MKCFKKSGVSILLSAVLAGCSMQQNSMNESDPTNVELESESISMNTHPYWKTTPDKVSPEQLPLHKKAMDIYWNKMKYTDNGLELLVDEAYILKEGLPAEFYDDLKEYARTISDSMKKRARETGIDETTKYIAAQERGKTYYYEYLAEFEKTGISMDDYQNRQIQELIEAQAKRDN